MRTVSENTQHDHNTQLTAMISDCWNSALIMAAQVDIYNVCLTEIDRKHNTQSFAEIGVSHTHHLLQNIEDRRAQCSE